MSAREDYERRIAERQAQAIIQAGYTTDEGSPGDVEYWCPSEAAVIEYPPRLDWGEPECPYHDDRLVPVWFRQT